MARGQGVPHLVAGDDAEGVVGPGRHGHLEGGGSGRHNVWKAEKVVVVNQGIKDFFIIIIKQYRFECTPVF